MNSLKISMLAASVAVFTSTATLAQSYTIQAVPTPESVKDLFGADINDQGMLTMQARVPRNAEFDFSLIPTNILLANQIPEDFDPETDTLTLSQYYNMLYRFEDRVNNDSRSLRLALNFAAYYDGQNVQLPALLNTEGNGASSQTNSADHSFLGLNQNNIRVGTASAPYDRYIHEYTPEPEEGEEPETLEINYAIREFTSRGLWFNGENYVLIEPEEQAILGGEAALFDINETNLAAGFMSTSLNPRGADRVETCTSVEEGVERVIPEYNCVWNAWHSFQGEIASNLGTRGGALRKNGSIYDMSATIWQLDEQGAVIDYQTFPPLAERLEDDEEELSTYAYAINNNGIAVGQGWTYWGEEPTVNTRVKLPTVYVDGETIPVTTDVDYIWGSASDINDDNNAIGFVMKTYAGIRRAVPFQFDVDAREFSVLPTFFEGSSTYPNAINNAGLVVGSAEIDSVLNGPRRRVGFLYNPNNPEQGLINLNDAVGCDATYFIVSADDINENNQIVATAIRENQISNEEGVTFDEQVAVTLILDESDGEITNCTDEENIVERQGAATSPVTLFAMLLIGGLITLRRKIRL